MDLILPIVQQYAEMHTSGEDPLLEEIHAFTIKEYPEAHMISGHLQGKLLEMISFMIKPKRVLEIGSFTGYSALCLAEGLKKDGEIHTIELREDDAAIAKANFSKSYNNKQVTLHCGNELDIIETLPYQWDLVFIDADKTAYIDYYELLIPRLSNNGIILADNVLFHGQVLENPVTGKNAKAIHLFNEHVMNDPRTEQVLLTIRDGISLIRKKIK